MTASELGSAIGASPRSIREYVRQVNARHGSPLIESGQDGYRLDHAELRRVRRNASPTRRQADGREARLYAIIRRMVAADEGLDVFSLADELYVGSSTIESDLGRARELLREYGLRIVRDRNTVRVEGTERQKRRLVRYLLFSTDPGGLTQGLTTLDDPQRRAGLRALRERVRPVLAESEVDMNEYALNDMLVHLTIAAERVAAGYYIDDPTSAGDPSGRVQPLSAAVDGLADAVEQTHGVVLPASERTVLRGMLMTHSTSLEFARREEFRADLPLEVTRSALREVSTQFGLDMYDETTVTRLALHVKNLIARSRLDQNLSTPLGVSFRASHPFIHELALIVARHIESHADVQISDGEVDFLAFHLGNQVQRQLHQGPPVTITCVVPQYGSLHHELVERLSAVVAPRAVVEDVVTSLVGDWSHITSDLVVSVVDPPADVPVPVIQVSPFFTEDDASAVIARVQRERTRIRQDKLRATVVSLFDPTLFRHEVTIASKDEAIRVLSSALESEGYVGSSFEGDVFDRENRSPTAFGGQFAIPHSLYMDAAKTGIAVLLLEDGVEWGPSHGVRLVLMFAVSPDGRSTFRDVLDELTGVLNEPSRITALLESSTDHHTFVRSLSDMLSQ